VASPSLPVARIRTIGLRIPAVFRSLLLLPVLSRPVSS